MTGLRARIQGLRHVGAVAACAASVICCSGSNAEESPPPQEEQTPTQPPARDESSSQAAASSNAASPPPPAPPSAPEPGLNFPSDPPAVQPPMGWVVDDENQLVKFPLAAPGLVTTMKIAGLADGEKIVGIDIRPADGKIYALGTSSRIYTLDKMTGAATAVSKQPFTPGLAGQGWGMDFNPVVDKIRVVTEFDQNLRLDPTTGAVVMNTADAMLAFAAGDANEGQSPALVGAAYTNSVAPAPKTTTLYGIDATRDLLVKIATPNDGKVTTVGDLGIIVADDTLGFDIRGTEETQLEAYLAVRVGEKNNLYKVDLATAKTTLVAPMGVELAIHGMAIDP
jgi:hypothetical protein